MFGAVYLYGRHVEPDNPNQPSELIVVQLNDVYRLDALRNGKRGGLARVATLLRQLKTQNPKVPVIVVHAGDFLAPSLESDLFHGTQMIDALNFLDTITPLYVVPGNHEFDYSDDPNPKKNQAQYLTDAINKSQFRWVASNLERNNPNLLPALRDNVAEHVLQDFNKLKVGMFALTIDNSHQGKDRSYAPISGDYVATARQQIQQLEQSGADIIFGLTHLDIGDDRELAKLRREHPRFRWIAGGHEHSIDREPASPANALVTKGDSNARTIWKVSVVQKGGIADVVEESVVIDENIKSDPGFEQTIENIYRVKMRRERPYLDTEISRHAGLCYNGTEEAVRNAESNWGSFLADNMRKPYKNVSADIGVINGGSIRIDDEFCERVTFEHLERTFAFTSPIVFVELTAKDLKEQILDVSAKSKTGDGSFLQVSGVSFRRERTSNGNVVADLKLQTGTKETSLDEKKSYIVAVPQFLFDCGDGYRFREYVKRYIPPGPDLRVLAYNALAAQAPKQTARARIVDLPAYAKPIAQGVGQWKTLNDTERRCQ
ncbi:MAG TPA: 5'-nucleotidase C-terminal domain-containing protein [Pyrinomonadaceae bacterium]|nr:5'-nucleotidase C-terminal domain-containing protein [Pyrinomonadaceae bacterium]